MNARLLVAPALLVLSLAACRSVGTGSEAKPDKGSSTSSSATVARRHVGNDPGKVGAGTPLEARPGNELAAFAGGCFWGVEDNFRQVPGVVATAVGYTGGTTTNPSYEQVCTHTTGHAEAVLVEFDPTKITYEQLVVVFFKNHDPTTMNRQGPDVGEQYRSAIFIQSPEQQTAAEASKAKLETAGRYPRPIVTEITPAATFYKAEDYHQQYLEKRGLSNCHI